MLDCSIEMFRECPNVSTDGGKPILFRSFWKITLAVRRYGRDNWTITLYLFIYFYKSTSASTHGHHVCYIILHLANIIVLYMNINILFRCLEDTERLKNTLISELSRNHTSIWDYAEEIKHLWNLSPTELSH